MSAFSECIDIHVTDRPALDERIESAVRHLQEVAKLEGTRGIMVTRHAPGHYTAALTENVPFGLTREMVR
jgi:hypothetical protein